jgi:Tfp pilus assembly protein FimV
VVRSGDTLWSIARRVSPSEDPRPIVDAIAGANPVNPVAPGALVPGQTLVIPLAG